MFECRLGEVLVLCCPCHQESLHRARETLISGLARPAADNQTSLTRQRRFPVAFASASGFLGSLQNRSGQESLRRARETQMSGLTRPVTDNPSGDSCRNQAACQMESRSWGNLARLTGSRRPPSIGQIIGRPSHPILHLAEQRLSGEMKGTPPERSHVPTVVHGLAMSISNHTAAASCRGNLPVGSLSFGAPASTFHSAARALLTLLPAAPLEPPPVLPAAHDQLGQLGSRRLVGCRVFLPFEP